ncbi:MAG: MoaD/ThiS family protein [Dehalococcoidia bacterium]|nr:MoaD/ThiS family protein [Dehalococcoidia bacterium]
MPKISVPTLLRPLCDGAREVQVPGGTFESVLRSIDEQCPGFYDRVVDPEENRLHVDLAVALDGEVVTLYLHEPVAEDAHLSIVPALGGGSG